MIVLGTLQVVDRLGPTGSLLLVQASPSTAADAEELLESAVS